VTRIDLRPLAELAVAAADAAGTFLLQGWSDPRREVRTKSTGTDMVSEMDHGAERILVDTILTARPDDGILGEEGADRPSGTGVRWVVDPLDGTTNYLYGLASWCVSVGVELDGVPVVGVVSAPVLGERYVGIAGAGASVNGRRLAVSAEDQLGRALVATGFGYAPARRAYQGAVVAALLPRIRDVRRSGSAALDLCSVAAGRVDAYWEVGVQPWDVCAGTVIVREAGGSVDAPLVPVRSAASAASALAPGDPGRPVVASNGFLHTTLVTALHEAHHGIPPA
jgi:myo-inositol-1(or 4)-monophosphatase